MYTSEVRLERDLLGEREVPAEALYGIHTVRALENFALAGRPVHAELVCAYGTVKLACALTNRSLGVWSDDPAKADAIERACREMAEGRLTEHVVVDLLQGGAGTSTNMNVNEVLANRALQLLGEPLGHYSRVSPLDDINLHQSTNDTYPTALRLAAILLLHQLEDRLVSLQEAFQALEQKFAHVVKVARTELQDAVLTTLGREMGAYAEALSRDRWRVYKCEERLRVVNLGGTAIGTGLAAPRQYIFRVVDTLRELTGIGFARAENLVEATQNADVFVEVSGILKACAATLLKISNDLRLLSSGPDAGLGEIRLPQKQAGSSIMPGKVNPVMCEMLMMAGAQVIGNDAAIAVGGLSGNFELNVMIPVIAHNLLQSIDLLARGATLFAERCVKGLEADAARCRELVERSLMSVTALAPVIGYDRAAAIAKEAYRKGKTVREVAREKRLLPEAALRRLLDPRRMTGEPGGGGGVAPAIAKRSAKGARRAGRDRRRGNPR